jgi:hypothetical protein
MVSFVAVLSLVSLIAMVSLCGLPGAAGAALKLEANNIAEIESRATERVIWSAEARAELFWRFFILFFLAVQAASFYSGTPTLLFRERFAQESGQLSRIFFIFIRFFEFFVRLEPFFFIFLCFGPAAQAIRSTGGAARTV